MAVYVYTFSNIVRGTLSHYGAATQTDVMNAYCCWVSCKKWCLSFFCFLLESFLPRTLCSSHTFLVSTIGLVLPHLPRQLCLFNKTQTVYYAITSRYRLLTGPELSPAPPRQCRVLAHLCTRSLKTNWAATRRLGFPASFLRGFPRSRF